MWRRGRATMNVICQECEAEFFVETQEEVNYCVVCGEELVVENDDDDIWEEDDWIEDDD